MPAFRRYMMLAVAAAALAAVPELVAAQTLDGPVIVSAGRMLPEQLATGRDGALLAIGLTESPTRLITRLYSPSITGATTLDDDATFHPAVTAIPHGGFAAAWTDRVGTPDLDERTIAQRLSPTGAPTGPAVPASAFGEDFVGNVGIAPAGDGFVIAFEINFDIVGQRYDEAGSLVGPRFVIEHDDLPAFNTRIVPAPGGFLVAWRRSRDVHARLYAADATPLGDVFVVARMELTGLAVNPAGTLAAVVGVPHADDPAPDEMLLRVFTPDGASIGAEQVVGPRQSGSIPDVAGDRSGNFLVVAGPGIRARAYDASGTPLGSIVTLDGVGTIGQVKVSARREGGFYALRAGVSDVNRIARITLCAPGAAVCGDGALVATCEICDAGAGNSDAVPDACRTDCVPARCGDGTTDSDEECDDGNAFDCDGCTQLCELEVGTTCGDGIRGPLACGEACDDGNAIAGDGCTSACRLERIPGGGKSTTDCYAAWRIDNPSNDPRFDKRGVNSKQSCRDNDPACDFDGGVVGSCTFHLAVCVNNTGSSTCAPARLQTWAVTSPSAKQALTRPPLATVRSVLEGAVVPTVVGAGDPNACSPNAEVVVPLRTTASGGLKASKLKIKTSATVYSGATDTDAIQLRCEP